MLRAFVHATPSNATTESLSRNSSIITNRATIHLSQQPTTTPAAETVAPALTIDTKTTIANAAPLTTTTAAAETAVAAITEQQQQQTQPLQQQYQQRHQQEY